MDIIQNKVNDYNCYINTTIMIPDSDGLNSFYKVIKDTEKMFYIRKIYTETILYKTIFDEITKQESKIYQAKLSHDFDNEK